MNKKRLFAIIFVALNLFILNTFTSNVYAESFYSLYDLCKIAEKNARKIKIAQDDLAINKYDKKRALAVLMPRITAFGDKNRHIKEYDQPVPMVKMGGVTDSETLGIRLDQSFTLNGKEFIAYSVTRDQIEKSQYDLESITANYLFLVARNYYQILSAKKGLEISEADVKRLEKHKNSVQEKLQVGTVTKTALFRAQAELSKSKTNLLMAHNNLKLARASLRNLVDIDKDFSLTENQFFYLKADDLSYEKLVAKAVENRSELKSAAKIQEIAKKTISYEKGSYWPKLSIIGMYTDSKIVSDYDTRFTMYDSTTNVKDKSIEAKLSFLIFDGGLRRAQINQAKAKKRQADAAFIEMKNQVILESQKAWYAFETAKSTLETLKDELKSARENFKAVSMQFEYGLSDSVDMMDADTLFVSALRRIADAEFSYELSILDIFRIQGELLKVLL